VSARIPTTVITGFLGAGKTTLIRHVIERSAGRRLAVIVNEFGDVGFDGSLLETCEDPACRPDSVVELANGCICCTVADEFLPAMETLLARDPAPDHILIETSGLALPQPLVRAFAWPGIRHRVTVDGVIAVVDAEAVADGRMAPDPAGEAERAAADPSIEHESPITELFEDQLRCADLVVVTKGDLVDRQALRTVERIVEGEARAGTPIVVTNGRPVGPDVLIGLAAGAEDAMAGRESHHDLAGEDHDHDDFESFAIIGATFASLDEARSAIARVAGQAGVLRVKGRVAVNGRKAPVAVQAVGPRVEAWFDPDSSARGLVVIGERGLDRGAAERALAG